MDNHARLRRGVLTRGCTFVYYILSMSYSSCGTFIVLETRREHRAELSNCGYHTRAHPQWHSPKHGRKGAAQLDHRSVGQGINYIGIAVCPGINQVIVFCSVVPTSDTVNERPGEESQRSDQQNQYPRWCAQPSTSSPIRAAHCWCSREAQSSTA